MPLERDEHRIGGAIGGRGGADRISRDALGNEAAAEPAEIGAVEQIGLLVLAEREHDGRTAGQIERQRVGAAEIGVPCIEGAPVRRGEKVGIALGMPQIGREPEHRLAIGPVARAHGVAGRDIERDPVAGDAARRPDTAAAAARPPRRDTLRIAERHADDPAVVIAAIAVKTAIRDIEGPIEDRERAALVLHTRIEALALGLQHVGNIDRPPGQGRAVFQRQGEDAVAWAAGVGDHRIEVESGAGLVDDRGAGDAQRIDVAAAESRERRRAAERASPDGIAARSIDRGHDIAFAADDQHAGGGAGRPPIKRLSIEVPLEMRRKAGIETQRAGMLPGQFRRGEIAAPVGMAVIGRHRFRGSGDAGDHRQ